MDEKNFTTQRTPSDKNLKVSRTWVEEVSHLSGPFIETIRSQEAGDLLNKFVQQYKGDPLVDEFAQKYKRVLDVLAPVLNSAVNDPLQKMEALLKNFSGNSSNLNVIVDFIFVANRVNTKYKIFDRYNEEGRKNNLTPKESGVLDDAISPLFQWLPKIKLHLEPKASEHEILFEQAKSITTLLNERVRAKENLEDLFKAKGPNPFRSIFSRKRQEAFKPIKSCTLNDIVDFIIRHKDDHPEYIDAFFRKAKKGDRDFLKEFDAEPDHAALKRLYDVKGVGNVFIDKINKAYHYQMAVRMSLKECEAQLSDEGIPKELQSALKAKMKDLNDKGFNMPTHREMKDFLSDLKSALQKPDGLNYSGYLKLVTTTPPRSSLFQLENARDIFANSKVFKYGENSLKSASRVPVVPPRRSADPQKNSQGRPQRH